MKTKTKTGADAAQNAGDTAENKAAQNARPFWKCYFVDPILSQLTQGVTPDKIALTIAIGTGIGMFPIIGVTSGLAILAGIVFRLNQPVLQLVAHSILPLHLGSIYLCMRLGEVLWGHSHAQLGGVRVLAHHMNELFWKSQTQFWSEFGTLALHAIIVWVILVPVWATAVYFLIRPLVRAMARWKVRTATTPAG